MPLSPARAQSADEKIIVSGASGNLGGLTVDELLARGVPASRLILVSRTPDELKQYADRGASVRFGDFTKPESLPAAYAGGTRMLLISVGGSGEVTAAALLKRAIDAAKAAGVKHIAYTSYVGITRGDTAGRAADHQATDEDALKASGVAWTMLRNSIYMHGLIGQAARMVADGRAAIPPNESTIGYVTREDCARAAAAVLSRPGTRTRRTTSPDRSCWACARPRPSLPPSRASRSKSCRATPRASARFPAGPRWLHRRPTLRGPDRVRQADEAVAR